MSGYNVPKENFRDGAAVDRLCCVECKLLLKDPVQISCGHRLCKSCADKLLDSGSAALCPECNEELEDEDGTMVSLYLNSNLLGKDKKERRNLHGTACRAQRRVSRIT